MPIIALSFAQTYLRAAKECLRNTRIKYGERAGYPHSIDQHEKLDTVTLYSYLSQVAEWTGDQSYGMLGYKEFCPASIGPQLFALMSSETLGDALQLLIDCIPFAMSDAAGKIEWQDKTVLISFFPVKDAPRPPRQFIDCANSSTLALLHWLTPNDKPWPLSVHVTYDKPDDTGSLIALFGKDIAFSSTTDTLVFDKRIMSIPVATANSKLLVIHRQHIELEMAKIVGGKMTLQTRNLILTALENGDPFTLNDIAERLKINPRSLQNKLISESAQFSMLQDECRSYMAGKLLRHSDLSISRIAAQLGFRDGSSFHKACVRWFNQPPGQHRKSIDT